ncbi:response regulator [Ramlibacter sp. G-1-2-2]|uniref:histidine kinase n=1 Tax=Ramlibacter agri TaxID=2728837 RepID=A0A848GWS4_9BURK|nr:ATP-binding protein [Ramlibacter agri]NML42804.1 response regulator [Ramlibacter agri]
MHAASPRFSAFLRAALLPLACVAMLALSLAWAQWLTHDTQRWPGQRLTRALALVAPSADTPLPGAGAAWQPVTLPDNWKLTRPEGAASVWYRVPLDPRGIDAPAVLIPRLATNGRVLLNGSLLWDAQPASGAARSWNAPLLLDLPVALLRESGNELQLQVSGPARYRAGLSHVQLASSEQLAPIARSRQFWQHDGAMVASAVSAVAGLLMLLMWWATQRRDAMYLFFGLAILVWAARNSNIFLDTLPLTLDQWAVLVFLGHTWFNTLFGLFVLRFSGLRWRWVERAVWTYAVLNTLVVASGSMSNIGQAMAIMTVPATALFLLLIALLLRKGWRERSVESALMAASTITYVVLSLRDAMLLSSKLPYDCYYVSHYTGVLMLVCIVWSLVSRLMTALREVELLNVDLEHRVDERTQELQTAIAAKSRFLAAASHDLRQPVAAIGLLVGLLRERGTAQSPGAMVDRIDDAVASLEALLKGLLDLSRLESGTMKPRLEHVALQPLFDAVSAHERALAQDQGLQLRWRPTKLAVHTDPVLLEQMLRNLVSNGLRHSKRGGVLVTARRRAHNRVLLQVWDTGYGIPADQQAAVFEEFVQLDNPARERARGLGLGLAIVKRCAQALECGLRLQSRPGRGSCFSLDLPGARVPQAEAPSAATRREPLAGWHVIVVEDDPAVREAMRLRITHWGAEVTEFDGLAGLQQALDAGHLAGADLVVSDNRLAGGGAAQVVQMVRRRLGAVPALVVTGDTSPQVISTLAASGLPVLHKPFRTEQLLSAIAAAAAAPAA